MRGYYLEVKLSVRYRWQEVTTYLGQTLSAALNASCENGELETKGGKKLFQA